MKDWGKRKADFGGCGLPVVTLPDGMQLAESVPTSIYYGKLFGQYPRDPKAAHTMELILAKYGDVFAALGSAHFAKDDHDAQVTKAIEETAGAFIAMLEPMLAKSTFICGDKLTVVDFWVGAMYCDKATNMKNDPKSLASWDKVLKKNPNFKKFGEAFKKENANWLKIRPARAI